MNSNRVSEIYSYIAQNDKAFLTDLCEVFDISMSTLRRDLKRLHEQGLIEKQYGTVSVKNKAANAQMVKTNIEYIPSFHQRSTIHAQEKAMVAKIAAGFVVDNDVIFIDSGSTTALMINYMGHLKNVTIVTNNLDVVMRAYPYENIDVYVLPGLYKRSNNSFSLLAESYIYDYYNITKAFIGCSGITIEDGVSHVDLSERIIKRCTLNRTKTRYLLVDHTKFGYSAPLHLCDIKSFTAICTDIRPSKQYVEYCEHHDVQLYYGNGGESSI